MYVIAEHNISDAKNFWEITQKETANLPSGLKLHQVLPNPDGSKAVCLWEAGNTEDVKKYVEQ
ncbi:MAG: hypothetical protein A2V93_11275 [Ignavibacteria bacterium RBG_16_34_14]|nr:MAG: hypothetical protein A2V93_11275 [Ignavibacteria bacterium RBG_16_34_14]